MVQLANSPLPALNDHAHRIGPEKGVIHIATGAVDNALWDMMARSRQKPLWKLVVDMSPVSFSFCAVQTGEASLKRRRPYRRSISSRCLIFAMSNLRYYSPLLTGRTSPICRMALYHRCPYERRSPCDAEGKRNRQIREGGFCSARGVSVENTCPSCVCGSCGAEEGLCH
jgi:L-alanine-DL-glutamate epimerase-like enolase superfamily enzyme